MKQGAMDSSLPLDTVRDISAVGRIRLSQAVGLGARSVQKIENCYMNLGR